MCNLECAQKALAEELMGSKAGDVFAVQLNLARSWRERAGDNIEKGGFSGPVGPDQTGDRTGLDFDGRAVDGMDTAETLMQIRDSDHGNTTHVLDVTFKKAAV